MIIKAFKYLFSATDTTYHPTMLINNYPVNIMELERWLINGYVGSELMRALIYHSNTMPRIALSSVRNTGADILALLAKDKCTDVRSNVVLHPNTSVDTLRAMITDRDDFVRRLAIQEVEKRTAKKKERS